MIRSRLSAKGQVTVPAKVRKHLHLEPGDYVAYEIRDDVAVIRRVEAFDAAFHDALGRTLDEWASDEDEEAFAGL